MYNAAMDPAVDVVFFSADGTHLVVTKDEAKVEAFLEANGTHRTSKFANLVRNLNFNTFKKLRANELSAALAQELSIFPGCHVWYHELFFRGSPHLGKIKTQPSKAKDTPQQENPPLTATEAVIAECQRTIELMRQDFERRDAAKDAVIATQQGQINELVQQVRKRGRGNIDVDQGQGFKCSVDDDVDNNAGGKRARVLGTVPLARPALTFRLSSDSASEMHDDDQSYDSLFDVDLDGVEDGAPRGVVGNVGSGSVVLSNLTSVLDFFVNLKPPSSAPSAPLELDLAKYLGDLGVDEGDDVGMLPSTTSGR